MADLKDKMAQVFNEYAQAQNSFTEQGVKIINEFLSENNIDCIDFTEINNAHYKAFYDDLQISFNFDENGEAYNVHVISVTKFHIIKSLSEIRQGVRIKTDFAEFNYYLGQKASSSDFFTPNRISVMRAVLELIEYISTYYKVERKAVFVPKGGITQHSVLI